MVYSSFNHLRFRVYSGVPAFFGLSYPYTGHWRAKINGKSARVYRVNGAAHAVEIPSGESVIEFRYWSRAAFWGVVISTSSLALIGFFVCFRALGGLPRVTGMVFVLFISFGVFMLWHSNLYSGDNLETEYSWNYQSPPAVPNLAYGKKNWLGSSAVFPPMSFPQTPWHQRQKNLYVSRFVDGNRDSGTVFTTISGDNPAWFLDLNSNKKIKTVLFFEGNQDSSVNVRPLNIALSTDGNTWRTVSSVMSPKKQNSPTRIVFEKPQTARYIRINASGEIIRDCTRDDHPTCPQSLYYLSFDEVEVYGPRDN
jgi:hypothetical protein